MRPLLRSPSLKKLLPFLKNLKLLPLRSTTRAKESIFKAHLLRKVPRRRSISMLSGSRRRNSLLSKPRKTRRTSKETGRILSSSQTRGQALMTTSSPWDSTQSPPGRLKTRKTKRLITKAKHLARARKWLSVPKTSQASDHPS